MRGSGTSGAPLPWDLCIIIKYDRDTYILNDREPFIQEKCAGGEEERGIAWYTFSEKKIGCLFASTSPLRPVLYAEVSARVIIRIALGWVST